MKILSGPSVPPQCWFSFDYVRGGHVPCADLERFDASSVRIPPPLLTVFLSRVRRSPPCLSAQAPRFSCRLFFRDLPGPWFFYPPPRILNFFVILLLVLPAVRPLQALSLPLPNRGNSLVRRFPSGRAFFVLRFISFYPVLTLSTLFRLFPPFHLVTEHFFPLLPVSLIIFVILSGALWIQFPNIHCLQSSPLITFAAGPLPPFSFSWWRFLQ